ncbi:MAG TPA: hypothetical protein PKL53_07505 [Methylotenera sp.]|nr:hypothetical protein [Methylotenera sp.]HPV44190.1 hypothetical protein [Methylotenera sp.]
MAYLDALKVVIAVKPIQQSPILNRRARLVMKLQEQIECVKAKTEGRDYFVTKWKSMKSDDGVRTQYEEKRKIRQWWFNSAEGKIVFEVKYANKRIELIKGKTGIEIENLGALVSAIELLRKAVENGELDSGLNIAAGNFRRTIAK